MEDAAREVEASPHPAREATDRLVGAPVEADQLECLGRASRRLAAAEARHTGEEGEVLPGAERRVEGDLLRDEAEGAARGDGAARKGMPRDDDGARVEAERGREDAERRRLARAVRAEE